MDNPYTIRVVDEKDVDADLDRQIRSFLSGIFPEWEPVFQQRRLWHKTAPVFTVLCERATDSEDRELLLRSAPIGSGLLGSSGSSYEARPRRVIGHVAVVIRAITTTWNFRYRVASVQGVAVAQEFRGVGLSRKLLAVALEESRNRGLSFGILYCKESLVPFYSELGWKLTEDNVIMWNHEDLPISMRSNCPMYYELGEETFPEGPLDVHSFGNS